MNIIFVCHGNICRSPLGEILLNNLLTDEEKKRIHVFSRATSLEEIGNDVYPPMKHVLYAHGDKFNRHYAARITKEEFDSADLIFYMDRNNLYYLERMFGPSSKFHLISEYDDGKEVEDPWYTERFEYVYQLIKKYVYTIYKKVVNE